MLCLNMIVKNEGARILRALKAARPYIKTFAILDTGSTDDTVEIIQKWAAEAGIEGIVAHTVFVDFSQARNQALDLARTWALDPSGVPFDYILLQDADMELAVERDDAFASLTAEAYHMMQTGGTVTYANIRLLAAGAVAAKYVGRTHEFLSVQPGGVVTGARFIDHADGSNRADKYARDIVLLRKDLEDPSADRGRTLFYLAQSYRDAGKPASAEECYRDRIEVGGWDEELFVSQCNVAMCRKDQGDEEGFVAEMLKAHQMRPLRAEPLYDLAHYYREKSEHHTALVFVERGLGVERPGDHLFVNDFVYSAGLKEELSICGFYSERDKERAMKATNELALNLQYDHSRNLARSNMVWYLQPLKAMAPSAKHMQIAYTPRPGMTAMNPSVCAHAGKMEVIVRTVNYKINEHGQYMIGEKGCQDAPIETENYLLDVAEDLSVSHPRQITWDRPPAQFPLVLGLEDMRLYRDGKGTRRFSACVREQKFHGVPEQWDGDLIYRFGNPNVVTAENVAQISTYYIGCEKNWSHIKFEGKDRFVYRLDRIVTPPGEVFCFSRDFALDNISGGTQWLRWCAGYVSVVHEAIVHPATGKRVYQHRFVWADGTWQNMRLSLPFTFQGTQIEFAAGLCVHPQGTSFVISYGLRDEQAWFCEVSFNDVIAMLGKRR